MPHFGEKVAMGLAAQYVPPEVGSAIEKFWTDLGHGFGEENTLEKTQNRTVERDGI